MPLDPNIILQGRQAQFMGPQEMISLQNMIAQGQMNQLKLQEAREAQQNMNALRQIFAADPSLSPETINKTLAVNPQLGMKLSEIAAQMELRKAQQKTQDRLIQREDRIAATEQRQEGARNALVGEMGLPTRDAALAEAIRLDQAGTPFNMPFQSPERIRQLTAQAVPLSQLGSVLGQGQRGTVVGPGAGYIPPGGTEPTVRMPFAPKPEPAPVVRTVPNAAGGLDYQDMRNPGQPLAPAPQPKPPAGFRLKEDGSLEPIPGGPADTKIRGQFNADTATLDAGISALDRLADQVELVKKANLGRITGLTGVLPNVPGQAGSVASTRLEALKAQVGMGVLQSLRETSRTNASGLGQVTEREHALLQKQLGSLDTVTSEEELRRVLGDIAKFTEQSKARIQEAYNMKHKRDATPSGPPKITNDAEYDALPSGTEFIGPDGRKRRKP